MSEGSVFERATIEINWDRDRVMPALRCPVTGEIVAYGYDPVSGDALSSDYKEPDWTKVPTVLFHYIPEVGEFDFIRPELQQAIDLKRADLERASPNEDDLIFDLDDFELLSAHLDSLGDVPLVFKLVTHGIACGPVRGDVYIGLDLARAGND